MTALESVTASRPRRFTASLVVHWVLLPWSLLMWWGLAVLVANVSGPAPQGASGWAAIVAIIVPVFSVGVWVWIRLLRTFRRWANDGSNRLLPNWCYPLLWAFVSWLLGSIGFALRSWQFANRGGL
jgi:hypothetical protein